MDPFLPAMVLTSLCIAATKVYRHLRPNDQQQPLPAQPQQHDGDNLETADSMVNGPQEATFSVATSSARTSSEESPGLCDEKDTDDNDSSPSPPLTALAPVTPPPSPPRMTRQYGFYKSIHHERALLPTCHDLLISSEQVTQKDKNTSIPSQQVITKNGNQAQHGSTTSTAAQRYRAKKPWLIPQSATFKTTSSTRYAIRASDSHHPRQRHMISSSMKKISNDKTASYSSNEGAPGFSIPSSSTASSQATPPMTRQYAFCGSADTSSTTTSSSTTSSSSTNATQHQERRTRLTSPELMPPPPPRAPRRHVRPLLRRQNAFFADTLNNTMLASKRKRHLMDENTPPPPNSRDVRQRLNTDNA